MVDELVKQALAQADPAGMDDTTTRELVAHMAMAARAESLTATVAKAKSWWKRPRIVVPLGIGGALAMTAGAVLVPLDLMVDGAYVDADAVIPITYTTDTGVDVSCRYAIYYGDADTRDRKLAEVADFVATHDWNGIGQHIYDDAIANPFDLGEGWLSEDTPESADAHALLDAIDRVIQEELPSELQAALENPEMGTIATAITDCKGQLH